MGLGEPKKKVKYSIDPNALQWANNDSKFGKKLMEKMGWEKGKGLGLNENGMTENIKVTFKGDTKGMGYNNNGYDNVWLDHQDNFEQLLSELGKSNGVSVTTSGNSAEKDSKSHKLPVQSLETKSKESNARLHYKKFTRSKDLSNVTFDDLNCILGNEKRVKIAKQKLNATPTTNDTNNDADNKDDEFDHKVSFSLNQNNRNEDNNNDSKPQIKEKDPLFNTNKISMNDYFAKKMASKSKLSNNDDLTALSEEKIVEPIIEDDAVTQCQDNKNSYKKQKVHKDQKQHEKESSNGDEQCSKEVVKVVLQLEENAPTKAEKDPVESFVGSNLSTIYGYSGYNINANLTTVLNEKAKRANRKINSTSKNIANNPDFYCLNKKKKVAS